MRENLVEFQQKHSILAAVLTGELFIVILTLLSILSGVITQAVGMNEYFGQLLTDVAGALVGIGLLNLFGKNHVLKEREHGLVHGVLKIGTFMFVMTIYLAVVMGFTNELTKPQPVYNIIIFVLSMLAVGACEEIIYRGLVLNILVQRYHKSQKQIYLAVTISAMIFGSIHLFNMLGGVSPKSAFIQAVSVCGVGMFLGAVYLRSGNLFVVIVLHGFFDMAQLYPSGIFRTNTLTGSISYDWINLVAVFTYLIPALILLRKSKVQEIIDRYTGKEEKSCEIE